MNADSSRAIKISVFRDRINTKLMTYIYPITFFFDKYIYPMTLKQRHEKTAIEQMKSILDTGK